MTVCGTWIGPDDRCGSCVDIYSSDPTLLEDWEQVATNLLYLATAQQYPGICETTVQPCSCSSIHDTNLTVYNGIVTLSRYSMVQACHCRSSARCSCTHTSAVTLPYIPAVDVSEVITTDDGTLLPADYELQGQQLVRLDGTDWPLCDDAFRVTFTHGVEAPIELRRAAATLACEFYMSCQPEEFEGQCQLPASVIRVVRQGVTVAMKSALFSPQPGKPVSFGIASIDAAVALHNPHGLMSRMEILSPDDMEESRLIG